MSKESVLQREILSGRPVLLHTKGVSMQPLLFEGKTRVLVIRANLPLGENDLALFRRKNGQIVLHRIIRVDGDIYYIRGDNCIELEKVAGEDILGVVMEIHRKGKIFPVTNRWYLLYVHVWNVIYPMRRVYYRFRGSL